MDGDGFDDLVTESYSPAYMYLLYGRSGLADTAVTSADELASIFTWSGITSAGDFNADGYDDFLSRTSIYSSGHTNYYLDLWLGSATGPAISIRWGPDVYTTGAYGVGGRDWDGDGIDDALVTAEESYSASTDGIVLLLGDTSPSGTVLDISDTWASGVRYGGVGAPGDIDGDGYEDAALIDLLGEHVYLFQGPPTTGLTIGDAVATAPRSTIADDDAGAILVQGR